MRRIIRCILWFFAFFFVAQFVKAMESLSRLALSDKDDPNEFDLAVASLLVGLGAEQYIDIFRKNNIGQNTLIELSDEDLKKLGVDNDFVRTNIIAEVKSLPLYEENSVNQYTADAEELDQTEVMGILTETSQHLHRMHLSLMSNRLALRKTKKVEDCLLFRELYASDITVNTLDALSRTLESMEQVLRQNFKVKTNKQKNRRKKAVVGATGGAIVVVLAILLFRSLKTL